MVKRLIPILLAPIIALVVSTPARADLIDQVSNLRDRLLGRVSLVCDTNHHPKKDSLGFYPNSQYNVVFKIRKPGKIIKLQRYLRNKNYDELEGFTFDKIDDEYIHVVYKNEQTGKGDKRAAILFDRYEGVLSADEIETDTGVVLPFRTIIGKCKHGSLQAKQKF